MTISSHYDVLFRERADGHWEYFPRGYKGPGYRVDGAQRDQLLRLLKYQRVCYVIAIAVIVAIFALMVMRVMDVSRVPGLWFMAWSPVTMPILWFVLLSPITLLKSHRRRLVRDAPLTQDAMTLEELRYRTADILSTPKILLWLLFYGALVANALAIVYAGYFFDNPILIALGAVVACIFGRSVWHWVQICRRHCTLLRSRLTVPRVFD